jgi:hypothetical protein
VDPALALEHMILTLQPGAAKQAALDALTAQQQDSGSPNFHKFLTPAQFAASFGASQSDVDKVTTWLSSQGFHVDEVVPNHLAIVFSGTAAQVQSAFHSEIRQYVVNGETHYANASAPQMPAELGALVGGLVQLDDSHSRPHLVTAMSSHPLVPADYTTIYNLGPLYAEGISGSGQSIAIIGRSNVNAADIAGFRLAHGLPASAVTPVFATGSDPGITADAMEATLDTEWAGAIAPKASIQLVIAASTAVSDGVDLAAQYAVNHNVAPILSVSFGTCEAAAHNAFYGSLWQQAAAQGISVIVSAGDSGAAGCDAPSATTGTARAVNALCSTPFNTCVGGTMFAGGQNGGAFWHPGSNAVLGSAISYIPEQAWNESALEGGSGLLAGAGGVSMIYSKPSWQSGAASQREVPDVALAAAQEDGYLIQFNGAAMTVAGTSGAAPSFAAMVALINQKAGSAQGNVNPVLYALAGQPGVFHDITLSNNTVPGVAGYSAGAGYDLATGLGSVDAAQLADKWASVGPPTCTLSAASTSLTVVQNQSSGTTLACGNAKGNFKSNLVLSVAGAPAGVSAWFSPEATLAASSSSKGLNVSAAANAKPGNYTLLVTAESGSFATSLAVPLVVNTPATFNITPSVTSVTMPQGSSGTITLTSVHSGTFNSAIAFTTSGLPSSVSASFAPTVIGAPGDGSTVITLQALSVATPATYTMLVLAQGGGLTLKIPITVKITAAPAFTLTESAAVMTLREPYIPAAGSPTPSSATLTLTTGTLTNGFNGPISLSAGTLPSGVTALFTPATIAAPGSGTSTLTLSIATTATTGVSTFTVTAAGGTITRSVNVQLIITAPPTFTLGVTYPSYTLMAGSSMTQTVSSTPLYGYSSNIQLTATAPTGINVSLSATTIRGAYGTSTISIQPAITLAAGTYAITVTGTDPVTTNTQTATISLIVATVTTTISNTMTVLPGSSSSAVVTTAATSYTGNVVLSLSGLPPGVSYTFSPTSIVGGSGTSTLTLTYNSVTAGGSFPVTLRSSAAGVVFTTTFTLTI